MEFSFIESLDQLGTDIRVGVALFEGKEYYFVVGKDEEGFYTKVSKTFVCGYGVAMGDLVGPLEPLAGIPSSEEIIASIEEKYDEVKSIVQTVEYTDTPSDKLKLVNTVLIFGCNTFYYNASPALVNKNLLALPLFVEVVSGVLKSGNKYNFKKSDKILASLKKYQKSLVYFVEDFMFYEKNSDPVSTLSKIDMSKIPLLTYSGSTSLVLNQPPTSRGFSESFIPDTFDDLISYLCNRYVQFGHFQCCSNCRRFFVFTTDSKLKNCPRVIESAHYMKDIGRTCYSVGRLRSHVRGLYSDETQVLYQRNYKAAFARKKNGQITEEHFTAWGEKAREMRDRCLAGEISYDELEKWFMDNYLRE